MVHYHRSYVQQQRKGDLEQQQNKQPLHDSSELHRLLDFGHCRKSNAANLRLLFLFSLIFFTLLFAPRLFFYSFGAEEGRELQRRSQDESWASPCTSMANDTICCDRTAFRTDVCYMRGDVRTHSASNSIFLLTPNSSTATADNLFDEMIRPYTRKWETSIMSTIDELRLKSLVVDPTNSSHRCDVRHDAPAVFFSTGGYTGNVYHEFNDGLIPLYITSQKFNKKVVFVMLEYHEWWMTKHGYVISQLSDYPPIDFANDRRTHCFPEAIVGLKIHDELTIDASKMESNKTIRDFRRLLDEAYKPRVKQIIKEEKQAAEYRAPHKTHKPKLVIMSRNGSRAIENESELAKTAEEVGFAVEILRPERSTELAKIYRALDSCNVMVGVHGAAMTHFLFMRPGSVFVQIVPLGTDWAAETYYGEPATKLGLRYTAYKIHPRESSLYAEYEKNDPVLRDPDSVNAKGWEVTKKVYLDGQKVRLDLDRFRKRLVKAHQYLASRRRIWKRKER
ncbi:xylan glycosyltransferase MUCI21-like [Typha angustifolia]|uniref:xylan glycosyltransferase MUCI21-like n=1 Tax=Typha angustifolia TaxID=59011 RepID=UPI003C2E94E9